LLPCAQPALIIKEISKSFEEEKLIYEDLIVYVFKKKKKTRVFLNLILVLERIL